MRRSATEKAEVLYSPSGKWLVIKRTVKNYWSIIPAEAVEEKSLRGLEARKRLREISSSTVKANLYLRFFGEELRADILKSKSKETNPIYTRENSLNNFQNIANLIGEPIRTFVDDGVISPDKETMEEKRFMEKYGKGKRSIENKLIKEYTGPIKGKRNIRKYIRQQLAPESLEDKYETRINGEYLEEYQDLRNQSKIYTALQRFYKTNFKGLTLIDKGKPL